MAVVERIGTGQRHRAVVQAARRLDPLRDDRVDILALAQVGADRDVGHRILQPVVETGERQRQPGRGVEIDPPLDPLQPFQLQRRVRLRGDREHHERPVQLVQRRHAEPRIGRRAQVDRGQSMEQRADAAGADRAVAVGIGAGGRGTAGRRRLAEETVVDRPAIDPAAAGQDQMPDRPVVLRERAGRRLVSPPAVRRAVIAPVAP